MFKDYKEVIQAIEYLYRKKDQAFQSDIELKIYIKTIFELLLDLRDYIRSQLKTEAERKYFDKEITYNPDFIKYSTIPNKAKHRLLRKKEHDPKSTEQFVINIQDLMDKTKESSNKIPTHSNIDSNDSNDSNSNEKTSTPPGTSIKMEFGNTTTYAEPRIYFEFNNDEKKYEWKTTAKDFIDLWNRFLIKHNLGKINTE